MGSLEDREDLEIYRYRKGCPLWKNINTMTLISFMKEICPSIFVNALVRLREVNILGEELNYMHKKFE